MKGMGRSATHRQHGRRGPSKTVQRGTGSGRSGQAATTLIWLPLRNAEASWKRPPIAWQAAKAQLAIQFGERFILDDRSRKPAHTKMLIGPAAGATTSSTSQRREQLPWHRPRDLGMSYRLGSGPGKWPTIRLAKSSRRPLRIMALALCRWAWLSMSHTARASSHEMTSPVTPDNSRISCTT